MDPKPTEDPVDGNVEEAKQIIKEAVDLFGQDLLKIVKAIAEASGHVTTMHLELSPRDEQVGIRLTFAAERS